MTIPLCVSDADEAIAVVRERRARWLAQSAPPAADGSGVG
jgi:hypothetical protein